MAEGCLLMLSVVEQSLIGVLAGQAVDLEQPGLEGKKLTRDILEGNYPTAILQHTLLCDEHYISCCFLRNVSCFYSIIYNFPGSKSLQEDHLGLQSLGYERIDMVTGTFSLSFCDSYTST